MLQRQMPGLKIVMPRWFIPFHSEVFLGRVRVEQFSFSFALWFLALFLADGTCHRSTHVLSSGRHCHTDALSGPVDAFWMLSV